MWKTAKVKMEFIGKLCGSVPLSKDIVGKWLEARMPTEKSEDGKSLDAIKEEVLKSIGEIEEKVTLGFQKNEVGLVIRGATIKAHLKDCANQVKDAIRPEIKAFRSKVANKVFIDEYWVHIQKDGHDITAEDGQFDQPVHVMTMQGPRNALKTIRYIQNPNVEFTLRLLDDNKDITPGIIERIFEYGSVHGYGGERGMGEGKYTFQIKWA